MEVMVTVSVVSGSVRLMPNPATAGAMAATTARGLLIRDKESGGRPN